MNGDEAMSKPLLGVDDEINPYFAALLRQLLAPQADPWLRYLEQWQPPEGELVQ